MIRVLLVSPVQAVRTGLRTMLSAWSSGPPFVAPASDFEFQEAISLEEVSETGLDADVLVIGAEYQAAELVRLTQARPGHFAVLLLLEKPRALSTLVELPLRSWGILPLDSTAEELTAAIQALFEGLLVGSPALVNTGLARILSAGDLPDSGVGLEDLVEPLTGREMEVLQLLAEGLANKQIAARLKISEHTVKFHVSAIYTRLGVSSRTEAVRAGIQRGLVTV